MHVFGRKPEYPERTHAYTGRTCKLHTEKPQLGVEPGTLSLCGDAANHHTTVQPKGKQGGKKYRIFLSGNNKRFFPSCSLRLQSWKYVYLSLLYS